MISLKKLSIIDIGSNSIKVLIVSLSTDIYYEILCEEKVPFRMSEFLTDTQTLNDEGVTKLLDILSYFKHLSQYYQTENIIAIATEATRRLKNSNQLIQQIDNQLNIQIDLLPGEMEAYYGYLATLHTIDLSDYLQIDIGGSSMEIVLVKNKKLINCISLPLGAIVTSKRFNLGNEITSEQAQAFKTFIYTSFNEIPWLKDAIHLPIIGIGGTIRMISKIYRHLIGDTFKLQHQYPLTFENIETVYDLLAPLPLSERLLIKGITKERADIVVGCLMTIQSLMTYTDSKKLIINRYGIRQGVVFKQLQLPTHCILDYSLCNLLIHFKLDEHHNDRLKQSTLILAHQLGIIDTSSINILKTISKLHQVGHIISHQNVNKHTFNLLMNIQINGLTPKEQLMSAYAIRYLDRFNIKVENGNILNQQALNQCQKYSLILQLANYLVALKQEFISFKLEESKVILHFSTPIPTIYVNKLEKLSALYQEIFNLTLIIN